MKVIIPTVLAVATLVTPSTAASKSGDEEKERGAENWDGTLSFSAATATGNTQNTVLGLQFDARRVLGRYRHDVASGVDYTEVTTTNDEGVSESATTQNRWFAQYRLEAHTGDRTFVYARARYEEDEFSGFEERVFAGVGVGHTPIDRKGMKWGLLVGPGYQWSAVEETETAAGMMPSEVALFAGSEFHWDINEHVTFDHTFDSTIAESNVTLRTEAQLQSKLTETLSTRITYRVNHESEPPVNREPTDTLLSASVVYGF